MGHELGPVRYERAPSAPVHWHEYASLFPLLAGHDLEELRASIKAKGVLEPIVKLRAARSAKTGDMCDYSLAPALSGFRSSVSCAVALFIDQDVNRRRKLWPKRSVPVCGLATASTL